MPQTQTEAYRVARFGNEGEPIVIIDDFSAEPDALVDAAMQVSFSGGGPNYPGIRAPANARYLKSRAALLRSIFVDVFGMRDTAKFAECNYSLVTTPPQDLAPVQRLPHFDSPDPACLAALHYLCKPEDGGTAFYRHRATGHERITEARMPGYFETLKREVSASPPPLAYPQGSTDLFEQIGRVEAAFNRLVIYRGQTLHSGDIPQSLPLSGDPKTGRLTLNTFMFVR